MKIATLFSGIGSPEQGAKRVYDSVNTVFACEYDKYARESYIANYGIDEAIFYKDVHDLDAKKYKGMVDILIGGSPCQAFSLAGLRYGTEDERGKLIYQYIRVVDECKPKIIIYENVRGMLNIDNGNTIKDFVQALRNIGYYCHFDIINTKDHGIPQNRERLYLVGFIDDNLYHRFTYANKIPLNNYLEDIIEDNIDKKYRNYIDLNKIDDKYKVTSATKIGFEIASYGDSINLSVPNSKTRRGRVGKKVAQCLDTGCNQAVVLDKIRKLTPRECLRLQDFPDSFKIVVSDTQMYKQVGNSMSVNILEMIFRQIEKAKEGSKNNTLLDYI